MKLQVSKYAAVIQKENQFIWSHQLLGEKLGLPFDYEVLLSKMTQMDILVPQDEPENEFLRFLAIEFRDRGFLIPAEIQTTEEEYLNQILPLRLPAEGFFHCRTARVEAIPNERSWVFFGLPCDLGAAKPGTRNGPGLLRDRSQSFTFRGKDPSSLFNLWTQNRVLVKTNLFDLGDFSVSGGSLKDWLRIVEETVSSLPSKVVPVAVGGDHSLSYALISGVKKRTHEPFSIVQLDNHLDVQTWGEFNGDRPLFLSTISHSNFISHLKERFPDLSVFQCGVRAYQSFAKDPHFQIPAYLSSIGKQICDLEVRETPVDAIINQIETDQVYITLDVDVLSQEFMEATGYPAAVGVQFDKVLSLLKAIARKKKIIGMDIMELGSLDSSKNLQGAAERIIYLLLQVLEESR